VLGQSAQQEEGGGAWNETRCLNRWLSNHQRVTDDQGWWCWKGRRQFLFVDGHVEFVSAQAMLPAHDGFPDINLTVGGISGRDID